MEITANNRNTASSKNREKIPLTLLKSENLLNCDRSINNLIGL